MTTPLDPTGLTKGIDTLLADLAAHEGAARTIRAQLAALRKRIASGGKRAGPNARSGRTRRTETGQPIVDVGPVE